jgi:hypothetical protein
VQVIIKIHLIPESFNILPEKLKIMTFLILMRKIEQCVNRLAFPKMAINNDAYFKSLN